MYAHGYVEGLLVADRPGLGSCRNARVTADRVTSAHGKSYDKSKHSPVQTLPDSAGGSTQRHVNIDHPLWPASDTPRDTRKTGDRLEGITHRNVRTSRSRQK